MAIRFATESEIAEWDTHVLSNSDGGNVFQGDLFAEHKKLSGWKPVYLICDDTAVTVHQKGIFGLGNIWYIPKGPGTNTVEKLQAVLPQVANIAKTKNVFAIKIEPEIPASDENHANLIGMKLIKVAPIQPHSSTVLLDIAPSLDEIMASLNQKGRHAIKRADRDGVTVKQVEASDENCRQFYEMFSATAARQGFIIRSYDYHFKFWLRYANAGMGQLFFTYHGDNLIGCAFAMLYGEKSLYKDAASVHDKSVYGANHLMQWNIIQWAREQGSKLHDLGGCPPSASILDTSHPHYGIGRFKTSFSKHVTDWVGAYDLPVNGFKYNLWRKFGERLVKKYWWKKHHESWY